MDIEERLKSLRLELPTPPPLAGLYKPVVQVEKLLYVSGQGPTIKGVPIMVGKLGEISIEDGQKAAELCALNALSVLRTYLGDLNRLKRVVKLLGFVSSQPDFYEQPLVMNGCSQILSDLFGPERGVAARSAVGVATLPGNIPVEVEFIFELENECSHLQTGIINSFV